MKKTILILFLFLTTQTFAQLQITKDTIAVNGKEYCFTLLSYGEFSKSKPMKVFTCDKKDFQKIKKSIQECYKKYKVEYTDFYIMPIDNKKVNVPEITLLENYLKKIDETRMQKKLPTIQIPFKEHYNQESKKLEISYDETSLMEISKIENLHQNVNPENICYLISGRK